MTECAIGVPNTDDKYLFVEVKGPGEIVVKVNGYPLPADPSTAQVFSMQAGPGTSLWVMGGDCTVGNHYQMRYTMCGAQAKGQSHPDFPEGDFCNPELTPQKFEAWVREAVERTFGFQGLELVREVDGSTRVN